MGGKMSRNKGATVEREIISVLNLFYGCGLKRQLDQTREGGLDTTEGLPLSIEIKARKSPPGVQKFLDQATQAVRPGTYPIAIVKANNKPPIVVLHLASFMQLTDPYIQEWLLEASKKNSAVELPGTSGIGIVSGFEGIPPRGSRRQE